jgi:hypothetical protein
MKSLRDHFTRSSGTGADAWSTIEMVDPDTGHRRDHHTTQLLLPPRTKTRKARSHLASAFGINCYHHQWFTISPPCWLPFAPLFTIGGERLDMYVPGLFILAGEEPRVQ